MKDTDWFERVLISAVVCIITGVFVFIGYGIWYEANDPGHGTITGKHYSPEHIMCSGKPIICTTYDECYRIEYTDGKHDGDVCVSPQEYTAYKVGDQYPAAQ
jgi:hypothetical protein